MKKILIILIAFMASSAFVYAHESDAAKPFLKMKQSQKDVMIDEVLNNLQNHSAFDNTNQDELKDSFEPFAKDKNSKENIKAAKQGIVFQDGYSLGIKYNEMYSNIMEYYFVKYDNNPKVRYLYDGFGNLTAVDIVKGTEFAYPYIVCRYFNTGALSSVSYFPNSYEEYLFNSNKKLIGVKVYKILYNSKGTRLDPRVQNPVIKRVMPIRRY